LMRVAGRVLGGSSVAVLAAGTLLVLAAFFTALVYLYRLARDLTGDEDAASGAVWLLAAYPFAVYFSAVYTESLFLAGALGAFHHARRGEYWPAGLWALFVGLTRPNGMFLAAPLALFAMRPWLPAWLAGGAHVPAVHGHQRAQLVEP